MSDSSICVLHVDKFPVVSWIELSTSAKKFPTFGTLFSTN